MKDNSEWKKFNYAKNIKLIHVFTAKILMLSLCDNHSSITKKLHHPPSVFDIYRFMKYFFSEGNEIVSKNLCEKISVCASTYE